MNFYKTTSGRTLVSEADLSYAQTKTGKVSTNKVREEDKSVTHNVPNQLIGDILAFAAKTLPTDEQHYEDILNLPTSLISIATKASQAHEACRTHPNKALDTLVFPHLVLTNHKRYAVSRILLHSGEEGNIIIEENLTEEELKDTCFIGNIRLALFLTKASSGQFLPIDYDIDAIHKPGCYDHNRVGLLNDTMMFRDGAQLIPLRQLIVDSSTREQVIFLTATSYQLALCETYLTISQISQMAQ